MPSHLILGRIITLWIPLKWKQGIWPEMPHMKFRLEPGRNFVIVHGQSPWSLKQHNQAASPSLIPPDVFTRKMGLLHMALIKVGLFLG